MSRFLPPFSCAALLVAMPPSVVAAGGHLDVDDASVLDPGRYATSRSHDGGRIRLSVAVAGHQVVMTVSDVGAGIAPEAMGAIFDPFARDPRASAVNQVGLGIGVAVVRASARAHGYLPDPGG